VRVARFTDLSPLTLYRLLRLRSAVFVVEQASCYEDIDGLDADPSTWHVWVDGGDGGDGGGEPLAVARVVAEPGGGSRIGRVATGPAARGAGLAGLVMRAALEVAERPVVLDAQAPLVAWYERFGFRVTGPPFDDAGVEHVPMRLDGPGGHR
jgi:ElaA protein